MYNAAKRTCRHTRHAHRTHMTWKNGFDSKCISYFTNRHITKQCKANVYAISDCVFSFKKKEEEKKTEDIKTESNAKANKNERQNEAKNNNILETNHLARKVGAQFNGKQTKKTRKMGNGANGRQNWVGEKCHSMKHESILYIGNAFLRAAAFINSKINIMKHIARAHIELSFYINTFPSSLLHMLHVCLFRSLFWSNMQFWLFCPTRFVCFTFTLM